MSDRQCPREVVASECCGLWNRAHRLSVVASANTYKHRAAVGMLHLIEHVARRQQERRNGSDRSWT